MRNLGRMLLLGSLLLPLAGCDLDELEEINIDLDGYSRYYDDGWRYDTVVVEETYYYDDYYYPSYVWWWW